MNQHELLVRVARLLKPLLDRLVFTGGLTIPLYLDRPSQMAPRVTDDGDCIVRVVGWRDYAQLEEELRELELLNSMDPDDPSCRWICPEGFQPPRFKIDVMPTDERILGFTNRWFEPGIRAAEKKELADGLFISLLSVPYLIAAKIEAFRGRGKDDYYGSHDLEDLITVFDGCSSCVEEIEASPPELRDWVADWASSLLDEYGVEDIVDGHIGPVPDRFERSERVLQALRRLGCSLNSEEQSHPG